MSLRRHIGATVLIGLALATTACMQQTKRDRIEAALVASGVREPVAGCMAHRMAQKLTVAQLRRLQELGGAHDWIGYIATIRRINDPDALEVTISSFGLCRSGLIQ